MATIDTSIYQINPLRSVQQYENDIVQGRLRSQDLQQNALALETQRQQQAAQQRTLAEQDAIRATIGGLGPAATPEQQINALRGLATPTAYAQAESLQKQFLDRQKQAADVAKSEAETRAKQLDTQYKALEYGVQSLQAAQTPQQAEQLINNGVTAGHWSMQDAQGLLQELPRDLAAFGSWRDAQMKRVMSAKDQIDAQYRGQTLEEQRRARNQSDATTRRGQDMTDNRQRELATIARDTAATTKEQAKEAKKAEANEKAVTKYAETLQKEGIPEVEEAISKAEGLISSFQDDIPGYGRAAGAMPDWMLGEDGVKVRQALSAVRNIVLSARSGAAVTDQELRRLVEELGSGAFRSEDALRNGLKNLRERFEAVKANSAAGVSDDVKAEYENRGGVKIKRGGAAPDLSGTRATPVVPAGVVPDDIQALLKKHGNR